MGSEEPSLYDTLSSAVSKIDENHLAKILFLSSSQMKVDDENGTEDYQGKFLKPFQDALEAKNIKPVRHALLVKLMALSITENRPCSSQSTLEDNFSRKNDTLTENEVAILEINEIFQMLSISIPEFICSKNKSIVCSRKIVVPERANINEKNEEYSVFFTYTEFIFFSQICEILSAKDVCRVILVFQKHKMVEKDENCALINIDECAWINNSAMINVAFYYMILYLLSKGELSRLHTSTLESYLEEVQYEYSKSEQDDATTFRRILSKLKMYPLSSRCPGLCLIFCMKKDRPGSQEDLEMVTKLFRTKYRFKVSIKEDPTSSYVERVTCELKAHRYKFYDSLVVWFMGHGTADTLKVKDKSIQLKDYFIKRFHDIEWLNKKPKLFFIQACLLKGKSSETQQHSAALVTQSDAIKVGSGTGLGWMNNYGDFLEVNHINSYADTLISYATNLGAPASRGQEGSLYVKTLVDQLEKYGHVESIENILRKVHYYVNIVLLKTENDENIWKQTPYYECSLQKEFVFPWFDDGHRHTNV